MINLVVVGVHGAERREIVTLALGLGADGLSFRECGGTFGKVLRGRRGVGVPEQAERNAPIGDRALGISLQHLLESLLRSAVPEGMLVEHAAVEQLLRVRLARCLEVNPAELRIVDLPERRRHQHNARGGQHD